MHGRVRTAARWEAAIRVSRFGHWGMQLHDALLEVL
jgi:hypothetical protein